MRNTTTTAPVINTWWRMGHSCQADIFVCDRKSGSWHVQRILLRGGILVNGAFHRLSLPHTLKEMRSTLQADVKYSYQYHVHLGGVTINLKSVSNSVLPICEISTYLWKYPQFSLFRRIQSSFQAVLSQLSVLVLLFSILSYYKPRSSSCLCSSWCHVNLGPLGSWLWGPGPRPRPEKLQIV